MEAADALARQLRRVALGSDERAGFPDMAVTFLVTFLTERD